MPLRLVMPSSDSPHPDDFVVLAAIIPCHIQWPCVRDFVRRLKLWIIFCTMSLEDYAFFFSKWNCCLVCGEPHMWSVYGSCLDKLQRAKTMILGLMVLREVHLKDI